MGIFSLLDKEQKQAVGLLSIGTFLEYFDLILYVHMAVLLNELFFPKTDPHTAVLLTASTFCLTYIFRPIGALFFGWIGDNIGRKVTVILTIMFMSLTSIFIANLPTYAQIGITASWSIVICRIIQGISSMGEITGAQLYLSETIKPPVQYPVVAFLGFVVAIGTAASLGVASLIISFGFSWRIAFGLGAVIALVGATARIKLRETPDFADAKLRIKNANERNNLDDKHPIDYTIIQEEKVNQKTTLALFLMDCMWPLCFYFSYIHCGTILKHFFSYSPEQIIYQNFIVSIMQIISYLLFVLLSYRVYLLKILKAKLIICAVIIAFSPYWLDNISSPLYLLLLQSAIIFFAPDSAPATSIFYKHFPVLKRFTYISFTYALSRAITYVITSFGLVYLTETLGSWGVLIIIIPVFIGYIFGLRHFEKLDKGGRNIDTNTNSHYDLAENLAH